MKNKILYTLLFLLNISFAQESVSELLKKYNSESIPYITVQELAMPKTKAILLDSREIIEFETSHLKDAIYVGYDNFNIKRITNQITDKSTTIVVYCSLGIRSEDIAEQLKKANYTNVYNLFGGIFEWKNNGYAVYNSENKETDKVHAFSKKWSKWLKKGEKIYTKDGLKND
ncbi:rhodanese-like domain-containing protein [Winogradskyella sp. UBA3174]|uniref:rhodanese-like domain-containing protein n=1 Tax=Winogradskyella sp. UBA3174 TaxID=1947785 RepID=UPI0025E1798F|nr:rhodanese-like domain-containing protein [Winogradskyella sp. UBA3174]|tara:strand:+ start:11054 stop:11569 length:516 start_codon:yes stop_codon:yes gene_type:complete